jgi:hypothetical protein
LAEEGEEGGGGDRERKREREDGELLFFSFAT